MNTLEAVKFQTKTQHVGWFWLPLCSNPFCSRGFGVGFWVPKHLLKGYLEH